MLQPSNLKVDDMWPFQFKVGLLHIYFAPIAAAISEN